MKLKDIRMARDCKKELILQYFLRELKILQKYYYEKSRIKSKNKKEFTKKQLDLVNMKPESRDIVLKYYYDYYIKIQFVPIATKHFYKHCCLYGLYNFRLNKIMIHILY